VATSKGKKHKDERDPLEIHLEGNLRTLRERGLDHPELHAFDALLKVANKLGFAGTPQNKLEAALELTISHIEDEPEVETLRLIFGLRPTTQNTRGLASHQRLVAAWKYARQNIDKDGNFSYFRTHRLRKRMEELAGKLFTLYCDPPTVSDMVESDSQTQLKPVVSAKANSTTSQRKRRLVQLGIIIPVVVSMVFVLTTGHSLSQKALPPLFHLSAESRRLLSNEIVNKWNFEATDELGYTDESTEGHTSVHFRAGGIHPPLNYVRTFTGSHQDELLGVTTTHVADGRQLGPVTSRAVFAHPGEIVWLQVLVNGWASPVPRCREIPPTGVYLFLSLWNSGNNRLHIIRAWVFGENTFPAWITDAVAVETTQAVTLEPDSSISREYTPGTGPDADDPVTDIEPAFLAPGLALDEHGVMTDCLGVSLSIAFRQT
jgi:hypothetical protein